MNRQKHKVGVPRKERQSAVSLWTLRKHGPIKGPEVSTRWSRSKLPKGNTSIFTVFITPSKRAYWIVSRKLGKGWLLLITAKGKPVMVSGLSLSIRSKPRIQLLTRKHSGRV